MKKGAGTPVFRLENASRGDGTGRKAPENITNPDFLRKNRTALTSVMRRIATEKAEESTGNGQKAGTPHPRSARSARDRTDDNGPFARRDAKVRKGKAHLIN